MFVYVLRSRKSIDRYYVGLTSNVSARLEGHNTGQSKFTRRHRPWSLVATVSFVDPVKASEFERYLKTGSGRAFCRRHF